MNWRTSFLTTTVRLLDIERLGAVLVEGSSFDPETAKKLRRRDFLGILTDRIVMPVMPELEDQDYLTTQAIADYLATHPRLNLDGILFPSAQAFAHPGRNVILFNKSARVLRSEPRFAAGTEAHMLETDSDGTHFCPEIWTREAETLPTNKLLVWTARDEEVQPALELDRSSLEIFDVRGVAYNTISCDVKHVVIPAPAPRKK